MSQALLVGNVIGIVIWSGLGLTQLVLMIHKWSDERERVTHRAMLMMCAMVVLLLVGRL